MIPMKNVNYLIGSELIENTPMRVFDDEVCNFIGELSSEILKSPLGRIYPDLSALAFWGRKAHLQKLKEVFGECSGRLGRGLCFHIAPSNIPVNFAFTYLFGLLAGNANIVRLPSKNFPQIDAFCNLFAKIVKKYPNIEKRTAFVKYPRDNDITAEFCKIADARMIWGGDKTIAMVKSMPTSPRCVDIAFADRYSVALFDGETIVNSDEKTMQKLAENFYNDTYLMDQNACSSPQLILWVNDSKTARDKFWQYVLDYAKQKYVLQDAVAVDKYTKMCEESISNPNVDAIKHFENILYRVELKELNQDVINHRGKGGFFFEYSLKNINEFMNIITEKYQTITYFGIDIQELRQQIISSHCRGIDRIVPVGKAMDIDVIWDGHDLIRELSRIVNIYINKKLNEILKKD